MEEIGRTKAKKCWKDEVTATRTTDPRSRSQTVDTDPKSEQ